MYTVTIEWDGEKPPTTFYNRLKKLGLYVRGDKELSPLARRMRRAEERNTTNETIGKAVIVQEGIVVCESESLAREIFLLARYLGARVVQLNRSYSVDFVQSAEDAQIYEKLESTFGKRGRPSTPVADWVVTCMEQCCSTFDVPQARDVVSCPSCNGLRVKTRIGTLSSYKFPESSEGSLIERWIRHRFVRREFEVPGDNSVDTPNQTSGDIHLDKERKVVEMMENSPAFLQDLGALPENVAIRVLDGVFTARTYASADDRKESRLRTCLLLYEKGVDTMDVSLLEDANSVELIDASSIFTPQTIAGYWMVARKSSKL